MRAGSGFELTYCSNIHPAHGWRQVLESLRRIPPELKRRISPDARFGIGLRLSNEEAIELLQDENLQEFRSFLDSEGLYVALINGFPFAGFHDCCLKDQVFAPDWHTKERVDYTLRLVQILKALLPEGMDGGVSTCPLSYKRWMKTPDWDVLIRNVVTVTESMLGHAIHLDIEPEPDGLVENTPEFLAFHQLLVTRGAAMLAARAQLSNAQAAEALRQHVTICYDVCHFAVEHEEPAETIAALLAAGVRIGRAQISSAVRVDIPGGGPARDSLHEHLMPLADSTYLHQVIGTHERFADLPEGLTQLSSAQSAEWRIHYHVPLFLENYGIVGSTQEQVRSALAVLSPALVRHLEIETYTWSVLPAELKLDLADSIEREYRWVLQQI